MIERKTNIFIRGPLHHYKDNNVATATTSTDTHANFFPSRQNVPPRQNVPRCLIFHRRVIKNHFEPHPLQDAQSLDVVARGNQPSGRFRHEREAREDEQGRQHPDADHGSPLPRVGLEDVRAEQARPVPVAIPNRANV